MVDLKFALWNSKEFTKILPPPGIEKDLLQELTYSTKWNLETDYKKEIKMNSIIII